MSHQGEGDREEAVATVSSQSSPSSSATSPLPPSPSPTSQAKRPADDADSPPVAKRSRTGIDVGKKFVRGGTEESPPAEYECNRGGCSDDEDEGDDGGDERGDDKGDGKEEGQDESVSPRDMDANHETADTNQTPNQPTNPTAESPTRDGNGKQQNVTDDDDKVVEFKKEAQDDTHKDEARETSTDKAQVDALPRGRSQARDPEVPWELIPHAKEHQATTCPPGEMTNLLPRSDGEVLYRTHDQHGFRYIFRPSAEWAWSSMRDPNGSWCYSYGALFPIGYQLTGNILGRPWVCPIRDCRTAWIKASDMGYHFSHAHHCCLLNDNLDGTFTVVGTYPYTGKPNNFQDRIKNEPYVVSMERAGSKDVPDIPIAPPKLPANYKTKEAKPSHEPSGSKEPDKTEVAGRAQDGRRGPEPRTSLGPTPDVQEDALSLSKYVSSFVGDIESNASPYVRQLLKMPRVREIEWNTVTEVPFEPAEEVDAAALLIHLSGIASPTPCSRCLLKLGPFSGCVILGMRSSLLLGVGPPTDCCANCLYGGSRERCSIRLWSQLPDFSKPSLSAAVPKVPPQPVVPRRGSGHEADATDVTRKVDHVSLAKRDAELLVRRATLPRANKPAGAATSAATSTATAGIDIPVTPTTAIRAPPSSLQPGSPSLGINRDKRLSELEDWEIAQARNGVDPTQKYVALSGAYLATGQVISIAPSVLVRTITLKPGMVMDKFACPWNATVMFLVISGKVQVKYTDENGDFSIGNHGMFRVDVGRVCNIANKCYADAMLHLIQCPAS